MSKDILLEIGTEEIPARYLESSAAQLAEICEKEFETARVGYRRINVHCTCRRLIVYVRDVSEKQVPKRNVFLGPSEKVAYENGKPTAAAIGFAGKYKVDIADLFVKDGRVCVIKREPSLETEQVLPDLCVSIIKSLSFPKSMVWEQSRFRFVRPIRWIAALFGKKIIRFQIADVKSSNFTCIRHKKKIKISEPGKFISFLRNKSIIADCSSRLGMVKKAVSAAVRSTGGAVRENDENFAIVSNLVEFPSAVLCRFDKKYLSLPKELIIYTLKNQKNFVVFDGKGEIMPYFVAVKDGISTNLESIGKGYEKVISARLEDADFYLKSDLKIPFEPNTEKLKGVIFHEKLGTVYDKVSRFSKLAEQLCDNINSSQKINKKVVSKICFLSKSDLVTRTVTEFPELQGIFGRICAAASGEEKIVSDGIEQHWRPITYDGELPDTAESSVVAIADKMDSIAGHFAAGNIPTGSADPYGLRRAALGIIKIAIKQRFSFSLKTLIRNAVELLPVEDCSKEKSGNLISDFIKQRLNNYFCELGISADTADAVLSAISDDIYDSYKRGLAVSGVRKQPDFAPIAAAFKRIGNILKQAEKSVSLSEFGPPDKNLFKDDSETALFEKFVSVKDEFNACIDVGDYETGLKIFITLRNPVDSFFEKVMVMTGDERIKNNRLSLLYGIYRLFMRVADFSKIVPKNKV